MKLLFLNTNIGYGGASKMLVWLANQFAEANHEVTFVTYREPEISQILSPKVNLMQLNTEVGSNRVLGFLNTVKRVRKVLLSNEIQIAVAFLSPSQVRLAIASFGIKVKVVFSHRGDPYSQYTTGKYKLINPIINYIFGFADVYVFQTTYARDFYSSDIRSKSVVIPNPIDPLLRTQVRYGNVQKRIVSVARLQIWQKRQDLLIESFRLISERYPNYTLDLYGDGPDEDALKQMASGNVNIRFMGRVSNVAEVIQNAAMFVLSSDFEGIPNALLEAMSLGIPCVSTDCSPGGAAMLIKTMQNGILVPRGNVSELANAMSFLIDNPNLAEQMGCEAMSVNQLFCSSKVFYLWSSLFEKICK